MTDKEKKYLNYLNEKFNEANFIEFIQDLLNLEQSDFSINEVLNIQDTYKEYIKKYKKVASYSIGIERIGVFIIEINDTTTSKERVSKARVKQRNYVASLLDTYHLDASIVAFYSINESSWRISFVKKEVELTEKGITQTVSPARRYSYLVGEQEATHTAKEFLFNLLKNNEKKFSVSEIEEQFNVEKVTKLFFDEYKSKYLKLRDYLDNNEDFKTEASRCEFTSEEFAKKLMGQIVFLYFLQKKGWLGVQLIPNELSIGDYNEIINTFGDDNVSKNLINQFYSLDNSKYLIASDKFKLIEMNEDIINLSNIFKKTKHNLNWGTGDKRFIRTIFEKAIKEHRNFFDDYLEPFFYTGLNKPRTNQFFPLFNCKVPFLNGGLFEELNGYRWSSAHFNIPNELFSNNSEDGILDFLDLYNFTIDEEEPLEKEVAVDPEMLGKIFEKLLDNNNDTGTFYTPRDIVYYMCHESLANYLSRKVGVSYNEILKFIKYGDIISQYDWDNFNNGIKKFEIGKSIYDKIVELDEALINVKIADPAVGSGAFPLGMVTEIVKLRSNIQTYFLIKNDLKLISLDDFYNTEHLVCDPYMLKLQTIENCIYAVDIEPSAVDIAKLRLWLSLIVDCPNTDEPKQLPNLDYKIMQGNSLLDEYGGVKLFSDKLLNSFLKKYKRNTDEKDVKEVRIQFKLFDKQDDIDKQMKQLIAYQTELFKTSDSSRKKELKAKIEDVQLGLIHSSINDLTLTRKIDELLKKNEKPWFIWKLEFFDVFKENGGFDIVIGNPPYIDSERMQNEIPKERELYAKKYIYAKGNWDIYITFFELAFNLLNDTGNMIYITPDKWVSKSFGDALRIGLIKNISSIMVAGRDVFESVNVDSIITNIKKDKSNVILIKSLSSKEKTINKKMISEPYKLDLLFSDYLDLLLKISAKKTTMSEKYNIHTESACATSDAYVLKEIIYDNIVDDFDSKYKIVNTGTIEPFNTKYGQKEMVYLKDKYMNPVVNKEDFHLKFKNKYSTMVNCNKIIMKGLNLLDAFIDFDGNIIPGKTTLVIKNSNINKLKLILGFLQSKCVYFYIKESYSASSYNGGITFTKDMIDNMPIPQLTEIEEQKIIEFVDDLINKTNYETNLASLNKLIYKLYDLTEEEIKIIENNI